MNPIDVVVCDTTAGIFSIKLRKDWAPLGASHVEKLVKDGWFNQVTINRVSLNFLAQFGIRPHGLEPRIPMPLAIPDDPPRPDISFTNGIVSFAGSGPSSRRSQIFITFGTQHGLGRSPWEVPIGIISEADMQDVVNQFYSGYGDMPPWGNGPVPNKMNAPGGQAYLLNTFPLLSKIKSCHMSVSQVHVGSSGIVKTTINSLRGGDGVGSSSDSHNSSRKKMHFFTLSALWPLFLLCLLFVVSLVCWTKRGRRRGRTKTTSY